MDCSDHPESTPGLPHPTDPSQTAGDSPPAPTPPAHGLDRLHDPDPLGPPRPLAWPTAGPRPDCQDQPNPRHVAIQNNGPTPLRTFRLLGVLPHTIECVNSTGLFSRLMPLLAHPHIVRIVQCRNTASLSRHTTADPSTSVNQWPVIRQCEIVGLLDWHWIAPPDGPWPW